MIAVQPANTKGAVRIFRIAPPHPNTKTASISALPAIQPTLAETAMAKRLMKVQRGSWKHDAAPASEDDALRAMLRSELQRLLAQDTLIRRICILPQHTVLNVLRGLAPSA